MLTLDNIVKYFHRGSVNEVLALDGASLSVGKGEFVTIIGSNGAGKSSLLNCVSGAYSPDKGRITLGDRDVTTWPEYRRAGLIARVFQDPLLGTCTSLTIEQNMALARKRGQRRGLALGVKAADKELFRERLAVLHLGLEDRLRDLVGLLSGGQRQALTMVMATLVRPELLLLDEHTAALDPKTAKQILELTSAIVESGHLTTLMVTHNMQQALAFGNRLAMMHRGKIILDVSGEEKKRLTVEDLLERFHTLRADDVASDRMLLG